jgi:biopolymer transport protein ExbD
VALGTLPDEGGLGESESIVAEINITPLTDIFLVLLIIFMITSTAMIESGPKVNLPEAAATSSEAKGVVITMDEEEKIFIEGREVDRVALGVELQSAIEKAPVKRVVLEGDRQVILGDVVQILDVARTAGATEVAIAATRKR